MLKSFTVTRESNKKTTRVRCETRQQAALRGAIKLGIRNNGRKPTRAIMIKSDDSYWNIYGWLPECNAHTNLVQPVVVSED